MPKMRFGTPTTYQGRTPYCPRSGMSVFKKITRGTPEQAYGLYDTLRAAFGEVEVAREADGAVVYALGSGTVWYVIGIRVADATWIQMHCQCHAVEVTETLADLAAGDAADALQF